MSTSDRIRYTSEIILLIVMVSVFLILGINQADIYALSAMIGSILTLHYFHKAIHKDSFVGRFILIILFFTYSIFCLIFQSWVTVLLLPYLLTVHIIKNQRRFFLKLIILLAPNVLYAAVLFAGKIVGTTSNNLRVWPLHMIFITINSILSILISLIIEKALKDNSALRDTIRNISVNELSERTIKKELIIKQYVIERNIRLEERERISLNIHNAVGHTITNAIMTLDAAETLYDIEPVKTKGKISLARNLVSQGLDIVRQAVRMIEYDDETIAGADVALALLTHIEHFSSVSTMNIGHNLRNFETEISIPRIHAEFLTSTLLETLSNGRHSDASAYIVTFDLNESCIRLSVTDNGTTFLKFSDKERSERIKNGFGLRKIERYVLRFGGDFSLTYSDGFAIRLTIPMVKEWNHG